MHLSAAASRASARPPARGFTLVELLVAITLLSILLGLAAPSFTTWIRNAQVRTVAEALQNGVRTAQAEAVRRNRQVVFSLTNAVPGDTSAATANGSYWAIHTVPLVTAETRQFLQGGPLQDAGGAATITGPAAICFNSAGRQTANSATGVLGAVCTIDPLTPLVRYNVSRSSPTAGKDRPLQVTVALGGQVRMCDPARALATSADGCPP